MIHANLEIVLLVQILNVLMSICRNVLLKLDGDLVAKVSFNHVRKRVRQLLLHGDNPPYQKGPTYNYRINLLELDVLKTLVNKRLDVKLEIHPHAFHYVGAWDSGVQRLSVNVIFIVSVELGTVKYKTSSFFILIGKSNLKMEALFILDLDLQHYVALNQSELIFSGIFGCLPLRPLISNIDVSFGRFIIRFLQGTLSVPSSFFGQGVLLLYV